MNASTVSRLNWRPPFSCDPRLLTVADAEHGEYEERWFSIGIANTGVLHAAVYLWSDAGPAAIEIRLISARKATLAECRQYEEGL